jgi:hypothetical protein
MRALHFGIGELSPMKRRGGADQVASLRFVTGGPSPRGMSTSSHDSGAGGPGGGLGHPVLREENVSQGACIFSTPAAAIDHPLQPIGPLAEERSRWNLTPSSSENAAARRGGRGLRRDLEDAIDPRRVLKKPAGGHEVRRERCQ